MRETHISWVFLTGQYAYKLKKPLDLGFANFSSLCDREKYCLEEVRRNQLYSPGIYLDVVSICGDEHSIRVGGPGALIDWMVRMRQFDDSQLACYLAEKSQLTPQVLSELARTIAEVHQTAKRSMSGSWGTPDDIHQSATDNVRTLRELISDARHTQQLDEIERWTHSKLKELTPIFSFRKQQGAVRECHGDLHLGNLVRWQGKLMPFDCIEFNPDFFWIDVLSEVAFLVMDLEDHGCSALGWHFLNSYLEHSGDYEGLAVFRFYLVYRAMVRAKVGALRSQQDQPAAFKVHPKGSQWHDYLDMATQYMQPSQNFLAITHGVSGSGKTHQTQAMIGSATGLIRIRSDVERNRVGAVAEPSSEVDLAQTPSSEARTVQSPDADQRYSWQSRSAVYQRLACLAEQLLDAGFSVLVDATFLKRSQREEFRQLAQAKGAPFYILRFEADEDTLRKRIRDRQSQGGDVSEATESVLEQQLAELEPIQSSEIPFIVKDYLIPGSGSCTRSGSGP